MTTGTTVATDIRQQILLLVQKLRTQSVCSVFLCQALMHGFEKEVGEALMALSLEAQAVARQVGTEVSTEGGKVLKEVGHHATDHAVKHEVAHGSGP